MGIQKQKNSKPPEFWRILFLKINVWRDSVGSSFIFYSFLSKKGGWSIIHHIWSTSTSIECLILISFSIFMHPCYRHLIGWHFPSFYLILLFCIHTRTGFTLFHMDQTDLIILYLVFFFKSIKIINLINYALLSPKGYIPWTIIFIFQNCTIIQCYENWIGREDSIGNLKNCCDCSTRNDRTKPSKFG